MADFVEEVIINKDKLDKCGNILSHAEDIIGSGIIDIVNNYTKELDALISIMHKRTSKEDYDISDKELEKLIIRLPILIYELNNILMRVGIKEDLSKILKLNAYNESYVIQQGTINDKKAMAELSIREQILLEATWKRSVKVISQKIDIAQELLSACKKLLSKRMSELEIMRYNAE